jgi:hypothetical protein
MKRGLIAAFLIVTAAALAAWWFTGREAPVAGRSVPFTVLRQETEMPPEIAQWQEANRRSPGQYTKHEGSHTYLMVAAGERPTGGYTVEVLSVRESGGKLHVAARINAPPPGSMVTMAFTYPTAVIRIDRTELPVTFDVTQDR